LGQTLPGAPKFHRHGHQRHPKIAQTLVISGVTLRPLLAVVTFRSPFLGQLWDFFEDVRYVQ
jgi:hypothetical protein